MHSKREPEQPQRELFEIDLEQLIDMSHPLVGLGHFIDWHSFEHSLGQHLSSQSWCARHLDAADGCSPLSEVSA
jgi:hypothetical protein